MWFTVGNRPFMHENVNALLKLQAGVWGFQFAEFPEAWHVEELDPDRVDRELQMKVAIVSSEYLPFSCDVL